MSHVKYVGLLYICCSYMGVYASYPSLFSFKLHDNALALHEYIRGQSKTRRVLGVVKGVNLVENLTPSKSQS
jgi:hypothetical protein